MIDHQNMVETVIDARMVHHMSYLIC